MGEKTAGKYMIKRVYKEESDKRKTIDKIADACIIEEVLYAGKRHLYLAVSYTHLTLPTNREV